MDIEKIRKDFPIFENRNIAYLDSGATTQKPIQVIKAVEEFYEKNGCTRGMQSNMIEKARP